MLPVHYSKTGLTAYAGGSLAIPNNEPLLHLCSPSGSAIRGIQVRAGILDLVCDESVNSYELNGDQAILTSTQLIPLQTSRVFMPQVSVREGYFFSGDQILLYDVGGSGISCLKKISSLQSVEIGEDYVRATNDTHYFEMLGNATIKYRLPGKVTMLALAAAGLLFFVEQWSGQRLKAYRLLAGKWQLVDETPLIEEWHFPDYAICVKASEVCISIHNYLYPFSLKSQKFGETKTLKIKPVIIAIKPATIIACDGRQVVDVNSGRVIYEYPNGSDEITAILSADREIWLGTLKGALFRLDEYSGITGLLPGAAFHGPIEISQNENTVMVSSTTHELELQCFFGGGLSLIPAEKKAYQSGTPTQEISSELAGSRLLVSRYGELKNILDIKDALFAISTCGGIFAIQGRDSLVFTDGESEPRHIGRFGHPVRSLDIRKDMLGGYTLLAADVRPGVHSLLVLNANLEPVSLESIKAEIAHLADGLTYLEQNDRKITIVQGKYRHRLKGDYLPVQGAAIAEGLLFIIAGGAIQVREVKQPDFKLIARISASSDLAFVTDFPGPRLTFDKYHSRSSDRLVRAYRKNGAAVSDKDLAYLMSVSQMHGFVLKGEQ